MKNGKAASFLILITLLCLECQGALKCDDILRDRSLEMVGLAEELAVLRAGKQVSDLSGTNHNGLTSELMAITHQVESELAVGAEAVVNAFKATLFAFDVAAARAEQTEQLIKTLPKQLGENGYHLELEAELASLRQEMAKLGWTTSQVRKVLDHWTYEGKEEDLISSFARQQPVGFEASLAAAPAPKSPKDLLLEKLKERKEKIQDRIKDLEEKAKQAEDLIEDLGADKWASLTKARDLLKLKGDVPLSVLMLTGKAQLKAEEVELITKELDELRAFCLKSAKMVRNARKAQAALGIFIETHEAYPNLLGEPRMRMTWREIEDFLRLDPIAKKAQRPAFWRRFLGVVWRVIDSPGKGTIKMADKFLKAISGKTMAHTWVTRTFLSLFKDMSGRHLRDKYALDIMRIYRGKYRDVRELIQTVRTYLPGSHDELLVTMAAWQELKSSHWEPMMKFMKKKAEDNEDYDKFYDRMKAAQDTVNAYGWAFSFRNRDGKGYYIVKALTNLSLYGAIGGGAAYLNFTPTQAPAPVTEPEDPDEKEKRKKKQQKQDEEKTAMIEEKLLRELGVVSIAVAEPTLITDERLAAAMETLVKVEQELSTATNL